VEVQAFGTSAGGDKVQWLVPDHLGTPRIIVDQTGDLAGVKRHDYLPFGEELFAGTGGRTTALGYGGDGVRQQFTSKERDVETGLDYFLARYFSATHGRFSSPDPLLASGIAGIPQSWNRYTYCINNPLLFVDPDGLIWGTRRDDKAGVTTYQWFDGDKVGDGFTEVTEFYVEGIIDGKLSSLTLNPKGPYSFFTYALMASTALKFIYSNDDFFVKGYKIGPTREQFREFSRTGAVDMMQNQAFDAGLFVAGLRTPISSGGTRTGLSLEGKAYELGFLKKHLPGTAEAGREIARDGSAHVFNDLATLSRVESEIFSRGVNTGHVRNWTRIGFRFDEPIGFRFGADGTTTALHYGEMKLRINGLYHIVPRTGPSL
jgi:RHS repeat-associated protein